MRVLGIIYKKVSSSCCFSGLQLNDDEMCVIRWYMGAFGLNFNSYEDERCYDTARMEYPLCAIVQAADSLAAAITETTSQDIDGL